MKRAGTRNVFFFNWPNFSSSSERWIHSVRSIVADCVGFFLISEGNDIQLGNSQKCLRQPCVTIARKKVRAL